MSLSLTFFFNRLGHSQAVGDICLYITILKSLKLSFTTYKIYALKFCELNFIVQTNHWLPEFHLLSHREIKFF